MNIRVVPNGEAYVEGFRAVLDAVARERRYIAFLEAPPLQEVRKFVQGNVRAGQPCCVALDGERVVGWCDISSLNRPLFAHAGILGMGVVDGHREQGVGTALISATLDAATAGLTRVDHGTPAQPARPNAL